MTDEPSKLPAFGLAQRGVTSNGRDLVLSPRRRNRRYSTWFEIYFGGEGVSEGQHSAGEISAGAGGFEQ